MLARVFLARFFENEITSGAHELRASFFYLIAFLAVPGAIAPIFLGFSSFSPDPSTWGWGMVAQYQGVDVLRTISRADKTFYLGFAMIAAGIVSAIVWNSLLLDRRDGLILGTLPIKPGRIVGAKLVALGGFVAMMAVGVHALASVSFGAALASNNTIGFAFRGIAAHFVASFAASAFVCLGVAGIQGAALAAVGPRAFLRLSPIVQLFLVALVMLGFIALPTLSGSVVDTLQRTGGHARPWILSTPPLWFLGLYERLLGETDPTLIRLSRTALWAIVAVTTMTVLAYPIAYRRLMATVVERGSRRGRLGRLTRAGLTSALRGQHPDVRAVAQFYLATIGRVERHRFALAIAAGVSVAWSLPNWASLMTGAPRGPQAGLLAMPLCVMLFLLVGLRVAAALPSDLPAAWMFEISAPARRHVRAAMERVMFLLGVVPVAVICGLLYWQLWDATIAAAHTALTLAVGALLIQILLHRVDSVPCIQRWSPEAANLRTRWPVYLIGFLILARGLPAAEVVLLGQPAASAALIGAIAMLAARMRSRGLNAPPIKSGDSVALLTSALRSGRPAGARSRIEDLLASASSGRNEPRASAPRLTLELIDLPSRLARTVHALRRLPGELRRDTALAARRLGAAPVFAMFSIATLAVGIGATTAIFSVIYSILWVPPPIPDVDRVADLSGVVARGRPQPTAAFSWLDFGDFSAQQTSWSGLAAATPFRLPFVGGNEAELQPGEAVNGDYFRTLGVPALIGRTIQASDDRSDAPPVVVLSHPFWRFRFNADADVIGHVVKIAGRAYEVIGVAAASFRGWELGNVLRTPSIWIPYATAPPEVRGFIEAADRDAPGMVVKGRLIPGRTLAQASAEMRAIGRRLEAAFPSKGIPTLSPSSSGVMGRRWAAGPIGSHNVPWLTSTGTVLIAIVGLVLLTGCTTLANLALARGSAREHERSIRLAIGASRADLVREQLVESTFVLVVSGLLAMALIQALVPRLAIEFSMGQGQAIALDPHVNLAVLAFAIGLALLALGVFGLWPALQLTQTPLRATLAAGGPATPPRWRMHRRLIAWQVAASVALFVVAVACIQVVVADLRHDPGIDVDRLAIATVDLDVNHLDTARAEQTVHEIVTRAREQPGIANIAASWGLPFGASTSSTWQITSPGGVRDTGGEPQDAVELVAATADIFQTLGVAIVQGRPFDGRDGRGSTPAVVLSESFARRVLGGTDLVGRDVWLWHSSPGGRTTGGKAFERVTIVGLAADTDVRRIGNRVGGVAYVPLEQETGHRITFTARASDDPRAALAALRAAMRRADSDLVVDVAQTGSVLLAGQHVVLSGVATLVSSLGLLALLLAMAGLFGVLSHVVARRTRELGVRLALRASPRQLMRLVVADGLRPVADGLVLGGLAGVAGRSVLRSTLAPQVSLIDPLVVVVVPALLVAAALAASYWPARRAARVDPNVALRHV